MNEYNANRRISANKGRRNITRKNVRGRIFNLRSLLKAYLRERDPHTIRRELELLNDLVPSVLEEIKDEKGSFNVESASRS